MAEQEANNLCRTFNDLSRAVRQVLPSMDRESLLRAGCDLDALIPLSQKKWKPSDPLRDHVTCYGFALNRSDSRYAVPGFIYLADKPVSMKTKFDCERLALSDKSKKLNPFSALIQKRIELDGAKPTGRDLVFIKGHYPIAVFFGEKADLRQFNRNITSNDYSFYALRGIGDEKSLRAVWANRDVGQPVIVCGDGADGLFTDAARKGYTYFGGFYNVRAPH